MAYWGRTEFDEAAYWLEKTMNDPDNGWAAKATLNLGLAHLCLLEPTNKEEALRLFEKNPNGVMSKLNAGFLYYNGTDETGRNRNPAKGKELIESAISQLIKEDGNDNYLNPNDCLKIAEMYAEERVYSKAIEYFTKVKDRCRPNDSCFKEIAEEGIQDALRRNI
jgi:Tfp pilus assembly protein PilF